MQRNVVVLNISLVGPLFEVRVKTVFILNTSNWVLLQKFTELTLKNEVMLHCQTSLNKYLPECSALKALSETRVTRSLVKAGLHGILPSESLRIHYRGKIELMFFASTPKYYPPHLRRHYFNKTERERHRMESTRAVCPLIYLLLFISPFPCSSCVYIQ